MGGTRACKSVMGLDGNLKGQHLFLPITVQYVNFQDILSIFSFLWLCAEFSMYLVGFVFHDVWWSCRESRVIYAS